MRTLLCSAVVLFASAAAHADEAALAIAPPATAATAADPNLDRGFVLPTAMTQPAGSVTYNNYELLLHGVSYGITDNLQISATVVAPIVKDMPFIGLASIKARLYRGDRLHLALQGSFGGGTTDTNSGDSILIAGAGGLASVCLREDCSSLLSGTVTYEFVGLGGSNGNGHGLLYGASVVHRVGTHVKLLAEVASGGDLHTSEFNKGALVSYGVRFCGSSLASDIGFIKPVGTSGDDPFVLGLPFASVSYRWH
jgi:hypothetical protein